MNFTIILVHSGKSFGDAKEFSQETIETIIAPIEKNSHGKPIEVSL